MLDIINSFNRRGYTQCGSTELHGFVNLNVHGKENTGPGHTVLVIVCILIFNMHASVDTMSLNMLWVTAR